MEMCTTACTRPTVFSVANIPITKIPCYLNKPPKFLQYKLT